MNEERYKQIKDSIELQSLVKEQLGVNDELLQEEIELLKAYEKLKDNWIKLKEFIRKNIIYDDVGMKILDASSLEDYMKELEQGSDSND